MELKKNRATKAANLLIEARKIGPIDKLPDDCRPTNLQEVYNIHEEVSAILGPICGWKVGASSLTAEPICAPLLTGTILNSPVNLDRRNFNMLGIESEIAFKFASDLPPKSEPYTENAVFSAIETAFAAIEICETRYKDSNAVDTMSNLADNISNGVLILGPPWSKWHNLQIDKQSVELVIDGEVVVSHFGGNKAVDIFRLIIWLANHLSNRSIGIARGQVITTGSWSGMIPPGSAGKVVTHFSDIGQVEVNFS